MLKQDKVFYSSLIGILLNTVSFLMREHREVFLCPYLNPILWVSGFLGTNNNVVFLTI